MPIYNKADLPMVEANVRAHQAYLDHAEKQTKRWAINYKEALDGLKFWEDIKVAIKK